jgi:hypothetical protein
VDRSRSVYILQVHLHLMVSLMFQDISKFVLGAFPVVLYLRAGDLKMKKTCNIENICKLNFMC